jgi:hypothetical protein
VGQFWRAPTDEDWGIQRENRDMVTYFVNEGWKMCVAERSEAYDMSGGSLLFRRQQAAGP